MNEKGLVSIVMPAYNATQYIEASIESVLKQTHEQWELIVVNDCSTDETRAIVEGYVKQDSRIKLINNETNLRVAYTRNVALHEARGEFIAFLDSDDLWVEDKLKLQVDVFNNQDDVDFLFGSYQVMDENGILLEKYLIAPEVMTFNKLLKGSKIGCLTVMVRKEILKDLEFEPIGHEDYLLWLNVLKRTPKAIGIQDVIGYYRVGNSSVSSNKMTSAQWQFKIYRDHLNFGFLKSAFYFIQYTINGFTKYRGTR